MSPPPGIEHAICRRHKGLIRETGDVEGKQFWCPIGREVWTYRRIDMADAFHRSLNYPRTLV